MPGADSLQGIDNEVNALSGVDRAQGYNLGLSLFEVHGIPKHSSPRR
jgi:hypothetical protein